MRSAIPSSPWDERLLKHIEDHVALEADTSSAYDAFADMGDPQIRYLAGLIAGDEHRHHAMLIALATSVRSTVCEEGEELEWGTRPVLTNDLRDSLLDETIRLIGIEKEDARKLKELRREVRLAPEGTIWPELVEVMLLDSEKHIRILKAIEGKLKRR
jgi:hypothetical protein